MHALIAAAAVARGGAAGEADTTAPTISDVSVSEVTVTGANWSVTTNEAGGTVYVRVRPSGDSAWSAAQIQAAPSDTASPAVSG